MELRDILTIIQRRGILLIGIIVLGVGIALYTTLTAPVKYQTSLLATIQAQREKTTDYQFDSYYAIQASDFFINTITGWIANPSVLNEIYTASNTSNGSIYARKVSPQNISIVVTSTNHDDAEKIASSALGVMQQKMQGIAVASNYAANFMVIASSPLTTQTRSNGSMAIIAAFLLSLIFGGLCISLLEYFCPHITTTRGVRNIFGQQILSLRGMRVSGIVNQETKAAEKFRFIRATTLAASSTTSRIIVVADINETNTSSPIAANLALSFARGGKKTILIDAHFSAPSLHEYFGKTNKSGFSELLVDTDNITKYLQNTDEEYLSVIAAGIKLAYASDTIERSDIESVLDILKKKADTIIIHVAPLAVSSSAFPLIKKADHTILVIKLGATTYAATQYLRTFLTEQNIKHSPIVVE